MDTPSLSKGALLTICQGGQIDKPNLQILHCKKLVGYTSDQYTLNISDSEFYYSHVLLNKGLIHLITRDRLSAYTIVRLTNYECKNVNQRKIIHVLALDILKPGSAVGQLLGDPIPLEASTPVTKISENMDNQSLEPPSNATVTFNIIPATWDMNKEARPNKNLPVKSLTVPESMSFHEVYLFAAGKFKVSCLNSGITTPDGDLIDLCQNAASAKKKHGSDLWLCHRTFKDILWKEAVTESAKGAIPNSILKGFRPGKISPIKIQAICLGIEELQKINVISSSDISHHTCQALNEADVFPPLDMSKADMLSIYCNNTLFPVVLLINEENLHIFEHLTIDLYLYYSKYGHISGYPGVNPPLNTPCMIRTGIGKGRKREERYYWRGLTIGYGEEYQDGCQYSPAKVEAYMIDLGFSVSIPMDQPGFHILAMPPAGGKIPHFENPRLFLTKHAAFEQWLLHPASVNPVSRLQGKWNRFAYEGRTQVILQEDLHLAYPSPFHFEEASEYKDKFMTNTKLQTSPTPKVSTFDCVSILLCLTMKSQQHAEDHPSPGSLHQDPVISHVQDFTPASPESGNDELSDDRDRSPPAQKSDSSSDVHPPPSLIIPEPTGSLLVSVAACPT